MSGNSNNGNTYPMKKRWQYLNRAGGCLFWPSIIVGSFLDILFTKWGRKVIPSYVKMRKGIKKSYLRVSAKGLEYRNWPFFELRCGWDDVKRIKKGGLFGDVLFLHRAEKTGFLEFAMQLTQYQVHLSSLNGWPDGGLEDDLRKFAPQLFR